MAHVGVSLNGGTPKTPKNDRAVYSGVYRSWRLTYEKIKAPKLKILKCLVRLQTQRNLHPKKGTMLAKTDSYLFLKYMCCALLFFSTTFVVTRWPVAASSMFCWFGAIAICM